LLWNRWGTDRDDAAWENKDVEPKSIESGFCCVKERGGDNLTLEKICGDLLRSLETLAAEDYALRKRQKVGHYALYVPIIATNAALWTCQVDPANVDMHTAEIDYADARWNQVSYLRFRKSFPSSVASAQLPEDLSRMSQASEGTVFVIDGAKLPDFLKEFSIVS
jgi:hypothetical protein